MGSRNSDLPFNLLVTHIPGFNIRREALLELHNIIDNLKLVFYDKNKLFLLVEKPKDVTLRLYKELPHNTVILRAIPIDYVVSPPNINSVINAVNAILNEREEGKIAVKVDGYLVNDKGEFIHRPEAAAIIGSKIDRGVNLKNPDILVYVKVTKFKRGYVAALFVDNPKFIFSSVKRDRGESAATSQFK